MPDYVYNINDNTIPYVVNSTLGPQGGIGLTGATGLTGPTGTAGASVLLGSGVPSDGLGANGDVYIDEDNGDVYDKVAGTWGAASGNFAATTVTALSDTVITAVATGEVLKYDGVNWINNTLSEASIAAIGHTHVASDVTDFDTEVSNNSSVTANTAKVTYPSADSTKVGHLTVTQAVNLDTIETDTGLNNTHRTGDGSGHSDVVTNTSHISSDGSSHADVATNTTHTSSNGTDHANVVLNDSHRVATNDPHTTVSDVAYNATTWNAVTGQAASKNAIRDKVDAMDTTISTNTAKVTNATHSGEVTGATTLTIAADAVTYSKMQNVVADERILGNVAGAGAIVKELTKTEVLTMLNVEDGADVTDATNVNTAGAVMNTDTTTASMSFVIDEDNMATDSATKIPTQQSVKAYVDASSGSITVKDIDGTPSVSSVNTIEFTNGKVSDQTGGVARVTITDDTPNANQGLSTGILTGGIVTINADTTKFDVSAGTGIVVDWSTPASPVITEVSWSAKTAVSVTNIATAVFTVLTLDSSGNIVEYPDLIQYTPLQRRTEIIISTLFHTDNVNIESVDNIIYTSYDQIQTAMDYIIDNGPIGAGNTFSADGANLKMDKAAGTTTYPFINGKNDPDSPTKVINGSVNQFTIAYNRKDGGGGFEYFSFPTDIDPNNYDTGTGSLVAVPSGKWTIQRFFYFGNSDTCGVAVGQNLYDSLAIAKSSISDKNSNYSKADAFGIGIYVTALIVQQGATDLSNVETAEFIDIGGDIDPSTETVGFPTLLATDNVKLNTVIRSGIHPHILSGGTITENGDGTVDVASASALIHEANSIDDELRVVTIPSVSSLVLTDNSHNVIYADYTAGVPVFKAKTHVAGYFQTNYDEMPVGSVTRIGNNTHMIEYTTALTNNPYQRALKSLDTGGTIEFGGGCTISEVGTLGIACTSGYIFKLGAEYLSISAFDTSVSDTFTYIYRDGGGGWTRETAKTVLVANNYDDGDGTLGTISNNKYSVHFVYLIANSPNELFVLYGQSGGYNLSEAEAVAPPASLPPELELYATGLLMAKIIIAKSDTTFTSVLSPFTTTFDQVSVSDHEELGGLQGGAADDHKHLTNTELTKLTNIEASADVTDQANVETALDLTTTIEGDILYRNGSGIIRLARGTNGQVLKSTATTVEWGTGAGGGHTIEEEGTPLTARSAINFIGGNVTATDNAGTDATDITITGGAGNVDDLGDVTITAVATNDVVIYTGAGYENRQTNHVDVTAKGNQTTTYTIDLDAGVVQTITATGNISLSDTGTVSSESKTISVLITASGADRTMTFPAAWDWPNAPTGDQSIITSGGTMLLTLMTNGTQVIAAEKELNETISISADEIIDGSTNGVVSLTLRTDLTTLLNLADTKGDIIAATANDAWTRLGIGTAGQVLAVDSGESTGMKWDDLEGTAIASTGEAGGTKFLREDGDGTCSWQAGAGGIANIVEDTSPQLGGMLDVNGNALGDGTLELVKFTETGSAVNEITITNAATAGAPSVTASGDDTNIDLTIDGKGTGVVKTLSSDIDVTGNVIVSGNVDGRDVATDGTKLDGVEALADVTDATNVASAGAIMDTTLTIEGDILFRNASVVTRLPRGSNGQVLKSTATSVEWGTDAGGGGDVVDDTTPQLGGMLDVNTFSLGDGTLELLSFIETGSAVNELTITNAATAGAPSITATGDDTNIDLTLDGKGTGTVKTLSSDLDVTGAGIFSGTVTVGSYTLPTADGSANYILETDGAGTLQWVVKPSGGGGDFTSQGTTDYNQNAGDGALSGILAGGTHNIGIGKDAGNAITTGDFNICLGQDALGTCVTGVGNIGIGNNALKFCTASNTIGIGEDAGLNISSGTNNLCIGHLTLDANTTGSDNIGIGNSALSANVSNIRNVAIGTNSLSLSTSNNNVGVGYNTLKAALGGSGGNVGIGSSALLKLTTATGNVGIGVDALSNNLTGASNLGIGGSSLKNATGTGSVGVGVEAGENFSSGQYNVCVGWRSMGSSGSTSTGSDNVGIGTQSAQAITSGSGNVAIGRLSADLLTSGTDNVLIGYKSGDTLTTGSNNTIIGDTADVDASGAANQIVIGADAVGEGDNVAVIGNASMTDCIIKGNLKYEGSLYNSGNALTEGATITPDLDNGDMMTVTLVDNRVLALPTNINTYSTWMIEVKQDATGSRTLDTTAYKSVGGTDPVLTTAANATDLLRFSCFGSTSIVYIEGVSDLK